MRVVWEGIVNQAPADLFDYLADARNEAIWHPRARQVEKTSEGPVGVGATFRGEYRGVGTLVYQIVTHDPPRQVVFHGTARGTPFVATLTLRPSGTAATHLTDQMEMHPRGVFKLLSPLLRPMLQRQTAEAMANLVRTAGAQV